MMTGRSSVPRAFMLKRSDSDPFDINLGPFQYFLVNSERVPIDTAAGRLWIDPADKQCLLYSVGQDHEDHRGATHSDDGAAVGNDIVLWPPIKSLQRAPEPEPAEEEVLDLIATDENIFGVMDVNEDLPAEGQGLEDMSPDDLEAAIAAELGGGRR